MESAPHTETADRSELAWLREAYRRLASVLDELPDRVVLHDVEGRLVWFNHKLRRAILAMGLGRPEDLVGKRLDEVPIPRELAAQVAASIAEARERDAVTREVLVPDPDVMRWQEDKATALRGADGSVEGIVFVSRDIHARKVTEARLKAIACVASVRRSASPEELLRSIIARLTPDLCDWAEYVPDVRDPAFGDLGERLGERAILVVGPRGPRFDEMRALSLVAAPVAAPDQPHAGLLLAMTARSGRGFENEDVTIAETLVERVLQMAENVRLTEALAKSEARFRLALANSNIAVFEHRELKDSVCWIHNPHFGRHAEEPETRRPDDFVGLVRSPEYAALVADAKVSRAGVQSEITFDVGGEKRYLQVKLEPIPESGATPVIVGAAVDVTDARRAQEELAQALVFRERVLSILGHDLNNPLAAVRGLTAMLARRADLDGDTHEVLGQIDLAARRMSEMIETLIDFSRARFKGGLILKRQRTDLRDVCQGVIAELEAVRPGRVVELSVDGDARGDWDAGRLAQAVSNLVGNALTHGAHDRPVRVAITGAADEVRVAVSNAGSPIPPPAIATLFEPFRRGVEAEEARLPGLGLGLYIVREIATAHGGSVAVESNAEQTTFTMRLPRSG